MAAPAPKQTQSLLLSSLLRLSREISLSENPSPLQKRNFSSIHRKCKLLSFLFEDLLRYRYDSPPRDLPRSAVLCLREILVVLQRFKSIIADCSTRSRIGLLFQSEPVSAEFHELTSDLSTFLDILPELDLADDVKDLIALLRRHCRNSTPAIDPSEENLRNKILSLISDVEKEIVPDSSRLQEIFRRLGLEDSRSCRAEIEILEREIGERASEKWAAAMIASVGLVRYAKCVLFGASTPRPESDTDKIEFPAAGTTDIAVPADFRCPISLDLMRDPVVVATGQTYDRESIARWIASGHATCPKTGQVLCHTNLVPNKALKNLISLWCREENIPFDATESASEGESKAVTANKAATEAARMTASFLVGALATSEQPEAANRVVHELRQLAKSGSDNVRVFIGDAGAVPLIVPLLSSPDADLQLNAVTALLNISILEANKKRIMHADGAIDGVIGVMSSGATWRARENAAVAVSSLCAVPAYRRRLGRDRRILAELVNLASVGPTGTKRDALDAIVSLAGDRGNMQRVVESGAIEAALDAIDIADVAETAVAVLAAIAKRGGAQELGEKEGAVSKLVGVLKNGSDTARENAASALVYLCRKAVGGKVISDLVGVPGIEWVIWEMMGSGTERGRRKAAAMGRICRRWVAAAADEAERLAAMFSDVNLTAATAGMTMAQS